jgi:putative membrane protein
MRKLDTLRTFLPIVVSGMVAGSLAAYADQSDQKTADYTKKDAAALHAKAGATDTTSLVKDAAQMNLATIRFGELAGEKAQDPKLKQFAQTLQQDHKRAQSELESIAKKHNVTLPTTLEAKCQEEVSRLEQKSGEEFDREFAKGAVEGHAMAIAHLQHASTDAQDSDVRQYTQRMLAKVKEHQRQAREVAKAVGVDQATITSLENKAQENVGSPGTTTEGASTSNKDKEIKN